MTQNEVAETFAVLCKEDQRTVEHFIEFLKQKHGVAKPDVRTARAIRKSELRKKKLSDFFMESPLAGSEIEFSRMKGGFRKPVEL